MYVPLQFMCSSNFYEYDFNISGAVGGKTGKTLVLPEFSKIERGGGSSGAPHCYSGLT